MKLGPQQRIIAWRLAQQPIVLRSELIDALWGRDSDGGALCTRSIDVRISQLRQVFPGITINVRWGIGYEVAPAHREALLTILADEIARNVPSAIVLKEAA